MKLTIHDLARMIDLSAVKANSTLADVEELARQATKYHCIIAYVLPCYLERLKGLLAGVPEVGPAAAVGFPSGGHTTAMKVEETRQLVAAGSAELDMVANIGMLISGEYGFVRDEIKAVRDAAQGTPIKVILECHYLTGDQIRRGAELCVGAGAEWVKTGTGWAQSGATIENIALIKSVVGEAAGVKASGGIRTLEQIAELYRRGARRYGIGLRSGVRILDELAALPGSTLEV
jgi:deoxyribose-phosphate aldolase